MSDPGFYVWPLKSEQAPPAPLRQMINIDSNTGRRTYPEGTYGGVFAPGYQDPAGWDWWKAELPKIREHLDKLGVKIAFVMNDIEWKEHRTIKWPYHAGDWRSIMDDFDTAAMLVKQSFPEAFRVTYADNWVIPNMAPSGRRTGEHLFFGWQERSRCIHGNARSFVNAFWDNKDSMTMMEIFGELGRSSWTHWIEKAKRWVDTGKTDGVTGKPILEQSDVDYVDPKRQFEIGRLLGYRAVYPTMLYWVTDLSRDNLNLKGFLEGLAEGLADGLANRDAQDKKVAPTAAPPAAAKPTPKAVRPVVRKPSGSPDRPADESQSASEAPPPATD